MCPYQVNRLANIFSLYVYSSPLNWDTLVPGDLSQISGEPSVTYNTEYTSVSMVLLMCRPYNIVLLLEEPDVEYISVYFCIYTVELG